MRIPATLGLLLAFLVSFEVNQKPLESRLPQETYFEVCRLVEENYFDWSEKIEKWVGTCRESARKVQSATTVRQVMKLISQELSALEVSHLSLWDPLAMRAQWLGESRETGLRVRDVQDHFIVIKLVDGGPAQKAGIEVGDEITAIDNEPIRTEWDPRQQAGVFTVFRDNEVYDVAVSSEVLAIDQRPTLEAVGKGVGVLTIPTFVSHYFESEDWASLAQQTRQFSRIVIDVRGNSGGNFVAMLRALSPFFCQAQKAGILRKPRRTGGTVETLLNDLNPSYQQGVVERAREVVLQTFPAEGCFSGEVFVLIDRGSASVTEVFAQAFYDRDNSYVWGDFSAGEVVQAVWHPLPLGSGYSLSVPDSMFEAANGQPLEGVGVRPLRILEYKLEEARQGQDSWIQRILEFQPN